jgi:hypothetical protein
MKVNIPKLVELAGINCLRNPLSGSGWAGSLMMAGRTFEVKARGKGFRKLYRRLEGHFGLVLAADRREPLLVMRLGDFLRSCRFRDVPNLAGSKTLVRDYGTGCGQGPGREVRKEAHEDG